MNIRPPLQSLSIIILIISSVLVRDTDSIPLPFSDDLNLRTFEQASSSPPGGGGGGDGGRLTEVEDPSSSIPSSSQFDASSTSNQIRSNDVGGFDSTFIVPGTDPLAIGSPNSPGGSPQDPSSPVSSPVSSPDISASPQQEGNTNSNSPAAISALDLPPTQDDTAPTRSNSPKSNNNVQSPVAAALDSEAAAVQTTSVVSASSASSSSSSFQSGDGGKAPNQISSQQYTADVSFLDAAVSASDAAVFVSETAVQQTVVASTNTGGGGGGGGGGGVQQSSSSNNGVPVDVVQPDNMESQRSEAAIVRQSFESESSQANQAIVSDAGNDLPNGAMPPDSAVRSSTREMAREAEAAAAADQTDANVEIRQEDTDRPVQEVRSQEKEMTMTYREESYTERPVLIVRSQEKEMLTYKDMKESGEVESSSPSSSSDGNPGQRSFKEEINSAYAEGPTFKEEGGASAATTGDDDSIKATEDKLQAEADNESSNDSKIGDDTNIENELPSGAIPPESAVESIVDAKLDNDKEDAAAAAPGSNSLQAERTAPAIVIAATEHEGMYNWRNDCRPVVQY